MSLELDLKKSLRPVDLALKAARKRQSSKTKFCHGTFNDEKALDLISIYENFCFVLALFEQRKGDDVEEAKELLSRLLEFQVEDGNFPIFIHEYPKTFDPILRLKIAPIFFRILEDFGLVLGGILKETLLKSFEKLLSFEKELSPLWQFRKDVCLKKVSEAPKFSLTTLADFWEYWVSLQFLETPKTHFYHPGLKIYGGPFSKVSQEGFDLAPQLLEWMIEPIDKLHPSMIFLSLLKELEVELFDAPSLNYISKDDWLLLGSTDGKEAPAAKLLWKGLSRIHSLVIHPSGKTTLLDDGIQTEHTLVNPCPVSRSDMFESNIYFDADPEIDLTIQGLKATVFSLDDELTLTTVNHKIVLKCEVAQGSGHFIGHIFKANRPEQILASQFEAFDWRIAIRTIQRSDDCVLRWRLQFISV